MSVRQIAPRVAAQFREELTDLVQEAGREQLNPGGFRRFVEGLKSVLASAGRSALLEVVAANEERGEMVERGGRRYRFKQVSTKEWLTAFGLVQVDRRYFQPDEGGDGFAPIDVRCGMTGRYLTPDVEEATALGRVGGP